MDQTQTADQPMIRWWKMNKFMQVSDPNYIDTLKEAGFRIITSNKAFTLFEANPNSKFTNIDKTKVLFTNRMAF